MIENPYKNEGKKIDNEIVNDSHKNIMDKAKKLKVKTYNVGNANTSTFINSFIIGKISENVDLINTNDFFYFLWKYIFTGIIPILKSLTKPTLRSYLAKHEEKMKEVLWINRTFALLRSEIEEKFLVKLDDAVGNDLEKIKWKNKMFISIQKNDEIENVLWIISWICFINN